MKLISILSMKVMTQKIVFSMVIFIISTLRNLIKLIDLNTEMDVILNMKLLNIEVIIVLYQQNFIVSLNVSLS